MRLPFRRRAGSHHTPVTSGHAPSATSPACTLARPCKPHTRKFSAAIAARTASRSTPITLVRSASATRSPPMPQPKSPTRAQPAKRCARCLLMRSPDACSSASRVKYISCARPNFTAARVRNNAISTAARASAAPYTLRSRSRSGSRFFSCKPAAVAACSACWPRGESSSANASQSTAHSGYSDCVNFKNSSHSS